MRFRWSGLVPALIVAFSMLAYGTLSITRHEQFQTAGYDLGIFDQAVRHYAKFMAPLAPLKGVDFNLLGDHFHPILAILAPFYWIWDDPIVLLVAQTVLIGISIWLIWLFADRKLPGPLAVLVTAIYALGWPLQGMVDFDFHEIAFALPLLAWAGLALDEERPRDGQLLVACLLLLLVREDMGACVFMLGFVRFMRRPRLPGLGLSALGLAAFFLVVRVIVPALGSGFGYWQYSVLEQGPLAILKAVFWPADKTITMLALLIPLAFLPLFSKFSLVALPLLLQRFLADREALWTTEFHYNAPVWTIFTIAAISAAGRILEKRNAKGVMGLVAAVILAAECVLSAGVNKQMFPLGTMLGDKSEVNTQVEQKKQVISQIPANTCITASDRYIPHLTKSNRVSVPGIEAPEPDFIVLHMAEHPHPVFTHMSAQGEYDKAIQDGYEEITREGDAVLLRNPDYAGPREECGPLAG